MMPISSFLPQKKGPANYEQQAEHKQGAHDHVDQETKIRILHHALHVQQDRYEKDREQDDDNNPSEQGALTPGKEIDYFFENFCRKFCQCTTPANSYSAC